MPMNVDGLDHLMTDIAGMASAMDADGAGAPTAKRILEEAAVPIHQQMKANAANNPKIISGKLHGALNMRGFGRGVLKESEVQARIIRNASRYLTGEAQSGAIAYNNSDNRKTYNQNVSSTIQVHQMVVRDEQDIRSLAVEIATLTRRQQRGRGLRMA